MARVCILLAAAAALASAGCLATDETTEDEARSPPELSLGDCPRAFVTMHFAGANFTLDGLEQAYAAEGWAWKEQAVGPAADVQPGAWNSWVIDPPVAGVTGRAYLDVPNGSQDLILHFEETLVSESNAGLVAGVAQQARDLLAGQYPEARMVHAVDGEDYRDCAEAAAAEPEPPRFLG
jgi:hypothetical protein